MQVLIAEQNNKKAWLGAINKIKKQTKNDVVCE